MRLKRKGNVNAKNRKKTNPAMFKQNVCMLRECRFNDDIHEEPALKFRSSVLIH